MTDPRTLPAPFDRLVAILELSAAASNGYVSYESTTRARRSGDLVTLDAALWLPSSSGDVLYALDILPGDSVAEVDAVDNAATRLRALDARGYAVVSKAGFSRPARKRAEDSEVVLVVLGEETTEGLPGWLSAGGFQTEDLGWRVRDIALPPLPGLPRNLFENPFSEKDAMFANPQGRKFTAGELFGRWLRAGNNADQLRDNLPGDGQHVRRDITLRFDRPMKVLANTVRPIPPVLWCDFAIEAWVEVQHMPMKLVEAPTVELEGNPIVAFASDPAPGPNGDARLWMWLPPGETGNEALQMQVIPGETATP